MIPLSPNPRAQAPLTWAHVGLVAGMLALFLGAGCNGVPTGTQPIGTGTPLPEAEDDEAAREQMQAALATVSRMSEFLSSRPSIRVSAEIQYDAVQPSGQKIEFGSHQRVALQKDKRARFEVTHRDGGREIVVFGDGRLSGSAPDDRVYASIDYDGTVGAALDHIATEYGMDTPLSELFRPDLPDEIRARASAGRHIGTVTLDGVPCHHLAFRSDEVNFQIFVRAGDEPVPMRLIIDYHDARGEPQFRARLYDWDWAAELPASVFRFAPPAGAQRVSFTELLDILLGPIAESEPEE